MSKGGLADIESYIDANIRQSARFGTRNDLLAKLIGSAANANRKAKVIGGKDFDATFVLIRAALCDCDPDKILAAWETDQHDLLMHLKMNVPQASTASADKPSSIWCQFAKTIIVASKFVAGFPSATDFYKWADALIADPRNADALPLIIAHKVFGLGYTLACDFIKKAVSPNMESRMFIFEAFWLACDWSQVTHRTMWSSADLSNLRLKQTVLHITWTSCFT